MSKLIFHALASVLVIGLAARSAFAISCYDDGQASKVASNCVGCVTYFYSTQSYKTCSPSVPCTDQAQYNAAANACATRYAGCQIQCCTTDMCNNGGGAGNPVPTGQPVIPIPSIVSSASSSKPASILLGSFILLAVASTF